jgi:hypothetical protein
VVAEFFRAGRQTDMTELIVAFLIVANAPKNSFPATQRLNLLVNKLQITVTNRKLSKQSALYGEMQSWTLIHLVHILTTMLLRVNLKHAYNQFRDKHTTYLAT